MIEDYEHVVDAGLARLSDDLRMYWKTYKSLHESNLMNELDVA